MTHSIRLPDMGHTTQTTTPTHNQTPDTLPSLTDALARTLDPALNPALDGTLMIGGHDPALLTRQVEILDRMFTLLADHKILRALDKNYYESTHAWLHFALRIQKQCIDTMKARAAIDYMENLSNHVALNHTSHPHPGAKT